MKLLQLSLSNSITVLAVFLCFITSCSDSGDVYNRYQIIENMAWENDMEYSFTFCIDDVSKPYDIILEVRNNDFYPYRNIWIFSSEERPVPPVRRDTIEFSLADEYGRWYGKGFSLYESAFTIKSQYYFPVKGQYTFGFRHGMRGERLEGIQEIGLRVKRN